MEPMFYIIFFVAIFNVFFLLGCEGKNKLLDGQTQTTNQIEPKSVFEGTLDSQNYVQIEGKFKDIRVFIKRNTKWSQLNEFNESSENEPYYRVSLSRSVIFFNVPTGVQYYIKVAR